MPSQRTSRRDRGVPRARTIAAKRITREQLRIGALMYPPVDVERPTTRGDCSPCPICQEFIHGKRSESGGLSVRPADGDFSRGPEPARSAPLVGGLRLREDDHHHDRIADVGEHDELRLHPNETWPGANAALSPVERDDRSLRTPDSDGLQALRRPGDSGVPDMEGEFRDVLAGHGPTTTGHIARPHRSERQLRAEQLPVGDESRAGAEQAQQPPDHGAWHHADADGVECGYRDRSDDHQGAAAPGLGRLACGHTVASAIRHARPCLFVACRHSTYLDVNPETGSIKLNFPDREPWEMPADASCSLDVAERGGITLEETGQVVNITRERVRQIERRALDALRGII